MLATGFHVTDLPIAHRITGRDGRSLAEVWAEGMVTNRGCTVAGFPNLFLLVGPNVGVGHTSMVYMIESQVAYVGRALQTMATEGLATLETTPAAQEAYRELIAERSRGTVWLGGGLRLLVPGPARAQHHALARLHLPVPPADPDPGPGELHRDDGARDRGGGGVTGTVIGSGTVQRTVHAVATPDGAQLHAIVDGSPDAPVAVVLAHGWTLAQAAWDDVAALLAPDVAAGEVRLVRYDQRGHGRSTWGSVDATPTRSRSTCWARTSPSSWRPWCPPARSCSAGTRWAA